MDRISEIILEFEKRAVFNGGFFSSEELSEILKSEGVRKYWIRRLSERSMLWRFEKETYFFSSDGTARDAVAETMKRNGIPFYFGGMEFFNAVGLSTQISQTLEIFNPSIRGEKIVNGRFFVFRKVKPEYVRNGCFSDSFSKDRSLLETWSFGEEYGVLPSEIWAYAKKTSLSVSPGKFAKTVRGLPNSSIQRFAGLLESVGYPASGVEKILSEMDGGKTRQYLKIFSSKGEASYNKKNPISKTITNF